MHPMMTECNKILKNTDFRKVFLCGMKSSVSNSICLLIETLDMYWTFHNLQIQRNHIEVLSGRVTSLLMVSWRLLICCMQWQALFPPRCTSGRIFFTDSQFCTFMHTCDSIVCAKFDLSCMSLNLEFFFPEMQHKNELLGLGGPKDWCL